ncbi:ankyrin repeat-containing domain protein [Aspergillus unguis]
MDPISAFGLISGAFQVGQVITETLAGLASLREKYIHADLTIGTLEQQVRTIKAAIAQLEDWTRARRRESPAEYHRSLEVALDGCHTVMKALSDEVVVLTQDSSSNELGIGFRARVRVLWREDVMRGHQERLHSQVVALQLLVQACQCQSSVEQVELLRKAENRHIIWKVADDAATIRSSTRYSASSRADTASSLSQRASTVGDTVFEFDRTLASTLPYQRAPQGSYSRPDSRPSTSNEGYSQITDEGYASGITASPAVSRAGSLALPGHPSGTISPTVGHSISAGLSPTARMPASHTRRSKSDSGPAFLLSQSPGSKREKIQSVFRRLSGSKSGPSSPQVPGRGLTDSSVYSRRRQRDRDINTSIDLTSPDGASAPLLVKTAQAEAKHFQSRRTALLVAAHCGNESVSGSTALHLAASRGHCAANIEARDSRSRTALWLAAEHGEVNARADTQMTAIHIAAKQGHDAIVKLLVQGSLHYACEKGHVRVMEILLDNKVNVDIPGSDKRTPLICAAAVGELSATKLLLKRKASTRCVDDAGMTALHWAAYNGHAEVVDVLSSRKSSLTAVNIAKRTPLHLATMNSRFAVVELLLRKQVPVETRCQAGFTALHYACLANSADIEAQIEGELHRRPVHLVATQGSMALLNLLCDKGVSLEARDALAGHAAAVQNILDRGSPVHLAPEPWAREDSPLCLAAMERGASHAAYHGHPRVLEVLLSRTLTTSVTEGIHPNLQLEGIGFAPAADISYERKKEVLDLLQRARYQPESITRGTTVPRASSYLPDMDTSQSTRTTTARAGVAHPVSSLATVPEISNRVDPPQELPGTLEQGLPDSRSQTPEQMQGFFNDEEQARSQPIPDAFEQTAHLHTGQAPLSWEPQQPPSHQGPLLNHPTPIREPPINPDNLLSRNTSKIENRFNVTPVPAAEGTNRNNKAAPSRAKALDIPSNGDLVQPPALGLQSDSESVSSFSTASEGDGFPRDVAELPA